MRIKNRKKFIRGLLIIIAIMSLFACKTTFSFNENNSKSYKTIYVSNRETLWEIAESEQRNNDYYKDKDIREIVYSIKNINKLESLDLCEGQELLVAIES